jgi:pimeloyl-ACP methyl ester carboxylesterase
MTIRKEGKFEYADQGTGKTFILLHGLFGSLSNFSNLSQHLAKKYRVIVPKLPLYTLPTLNANIKALSNFLRDFIESQKFDKVILLGNSLGGHVSLDYALHYPEKVDSLVLTGSSGLYERAFGGSVLRRGDREFLRQRIATTFYDAHLVTDELVEDCYDVINDKSKLIRILSLAKSAIRHNLATDLPKINMNTCLIWGKQDNITPPDVAQEFNKLIPNSELFWIDRCGHAPMMEKPEEFQGILDNWLIQKGI